MSGGQAGGDHVDVAIIGGGAAGTLVAAHLLADAGSRLEVAIIEPAAELAHGAAYSTRIPGHLLNVIASRMSMFDGDAGHFVRFLSGDRAQDAGIATRFAPRMDYGRYLRDSLRAQPRHAALRHLHDRAVDIERDQGEGNVVRCASGTSLRARSVVLAPGNAPRPLPPAIAGIGIAGIEAWDYPAIHAVAPDADVCIVGSGLSMVDAVVALVGQGHHGRIRVLSRHGLMPLPHAAPGPRADDIEELLQLPLRGKLDAIRERARAGVAAGEPWQWTFDRLRPHGQALWRSLSHAEQDRFLRRLARYWDIHRHRIAPQVAALLDSLRDSGQLEVLAGHLVPATTGAGGQIVYRPRNAEGTRAIHADWIVNAMGLEPDIARRADPLLHALLGRGRIRRGPHGIGIGSAGIGMALDAEGQPDPSLLVLGAMRVGDLWESIAIPELRTQAREIAGFLSPRTD